MQDNILHHEKFRIIFNFLCSGHLSMLIAGMQTMIDGLFVGNILGSNAMASINIAAPLCNLF